MSLIDIIAEVLKAHTKAPQALAAAVLVEIKKNHDIVPKIVRIPHEGKVS